MDENDLLRVQDLKTYFHSREGTLRAVDGVSFALRAGDSLGIVGESGCGKSVTAQSIMRIVPENGRIEHGRILFRQGDGFLDLAALAEEDGRLLDIRGRDIAMIFQEPMTSFSPVYTVGNQIMESILLHQHVDKTRAREIALAVLARVGMPRPEATIDSYPFNLSGGMRQRAMIAMALTCRPRLLIADEPTTAVDVTIQAQVLRLIGELRRDLGMSLLLITHDLGVIAEMVDNVLVMYLGKSVERADVFELFRSPLHPYTRGLLSSVPKFGRGPGQQVEPIVGSVPSLYELPSGCKFHPRCPKFMAGRCDVVDPPFVEAAPGHGVACHLYGEKRGTA
jgi:peptide/nickel transport system ATP-binding protein